MAQVTEFLTPHGKPKLYAWFPALASDTADTQGADKQVKALSFSDSISTTLKQISQFKSLKTNDKLGFKVLF